MLNAILAQNISTFKYVGRCFPNNYGQNHRSDPAQDVLLIRPQANAHIVRVSHQSANSHPHLIHDHDVACANVQQSVVFLN